MMNPGETIQSHGTRSIRPLTRENDAYEKSILKDSMQMITDYYSSNPEAEASARGIGHRFGLELADRIPASPTSVEAVIRELCAYWSGGRIGRMRWENGEMKLLRVEQDSLAIVRADDGRVLCAFMEGLLEAVLEMKARKSFTVREVECGLARGESCVFRIRNHRFNR
jgi:predicted hydrocarbon binding protein